MRKLTDGQARIIVAIGVVSMLSIAMTSGPLKISAVTGISVLILLACLRIMRK